MGLVDPIEVDESDYSLVREIFYNFSAYDALHFEMTAIRRMMDYLKELFISDISSSEYPKVELTKRMNRFLQIMLVSKYCHFTETLGAAAISFLNAKMKGSLIRYGKEEEEKKVLENLAGYDVGDVVNFYRTISARRMSYIADFMGYPPFPLQSNESRNILEKNCCVLNDILKSIAEYYLKYIDAYNAYKHGYRIIPTTLNHSTDAILFVKDEGVVKILTLETQDIKTMLDLSQFCRSILQDIYENHRLAMGITNKSKKQISIRIYKRKHDELKRIPLNLTYPSREDRVRIMREEISRVLRKIKDINSYSGYYLLLDIDNGDIIFSHRNRTKIFDYYNEMEKDKNRVITRLVITRLTEKYIKELTE